MPLLRLVSFISVCAWSATLKYNLRELSKLRRNMFALALCLNACLSSSRLRFEKLIVEYSTRSTFASFCLRNNLISNNLRQLSSSSPLIQSLAPSQRRYHGMHLLSPTVHWNCDSDEHVTLHVRSSLFSCIVCGHAHLYNVPPGDIRHKCEHPPLLVPHGFGPAIDQFN
jgi:hypothetical protein